MTMNILARKSKAFAGNPQVWFRMECMKCFFCGPLKSTRPGEWGGGNRRETPQAPQQRVCTGLHESEHAYGAGPTVSIATWFSESIRQIGNSLGQPFGHKIIKSRLGAASTWLLTPRSDDGLPIRIQWRSV
jgi:hypothetical protein